METVFIALVTRSLLLQTFELTKYDGNTDDYWHVQYDVMISCLV